MSDIGKGRAPSISKREGDDPYESSLAKANPEVPRSEVVVQRAENRVLPIFEDKKDKETWREPFYFIQVNRKYRVPMQLLSQLEHNYVQAAMTAARTQSIYLFIIIINYTSPKKIMLFYAFVIFFCCVKCPCQVLS